VQCAFVRGKLEGINGVHIRPGAIALTRICFLAILFAKKQIQPTTVAFVAEQSINKGSPA